LEEYGRVYGRVTFSAYYMQLTPLTIGSDEVLEAMALRTLYEVLGLGCQVLGLGPQALDNWQPHNNFTFCNYSMK